MTNPQQLKLPFPEDQPARTIRGFRIFGQRTRPDDEVIFGRHGDVVVQESSLAMVGPYVILMAPGDQFLELSLKEAEFVQDALATFIQEAYDDKLTEAVIVSDDV